MINKSNVRELKISDFKTYYKASVVIQCDISVKIDKFNR